MKNGIKNKKNKMSKVKNYLEDKKNKDAIVYALQSERDKFVNTVGIKRQFIQEIVYELINDKDNDSIYITEKQFNTLIVGKSTNKYGWYII